MATVNIELKNQEKVNISNNLEKDKFYTAQLISPLGGSLHYFLADGSLYPDAPPKYAHLLKNHEHVQLKVKSTESVWAWSEDILNLVEIGE